LSGRDRLEAPARGTDRAPEHGDHAGGDGGARTREAGDSDGDRLADDRGRAVGVGAADDGGASIAPANRRDAAQGSSLRPKEEASGSGTSPFREDGRRYQVAQHA